MSNHNLEKIQLCYKKTTTTTYYFHIFYNPKIEYRER